MTPADLADGTRRDAGTTSLIVGAPAGRARPPLRAWSSAEELLLRPDVAAMGRRNRLSNFTFFLLAAAGGSGASVVAAVLGVWALISVGIGRFRLRLETSDYPVVFSSLAFFLVIAASALVHTGSGAAVLSIAALLPFVMPLFLVPRMRLSRFVDTLPPAFFGAAVGGLLLVPIVMADYFLVSIRVQGLSGNPGPLSVTGLLCAGWSILHFHRLLDRWHLCLSFVGTVGGSMAVIFSGMRGAWPLLPVCIAIALFTQRRELVAIWKEAPFSTRLIVVAGMGLTLGAVVVVAMPTIFLRIDQMWSDLGLIASNSDTPTSLNLRRGMYDAALRAIAERPWFGYGAEHHWAAVMPYLNPATFEGMTFTHFHNVLLTVTVDAGVVGLAAFVAMVVAPVWTAWQARSAFGGGRRLGASLILVVAFLGAGMTNIMLFHDILDAVWVFSISLLAASVPATTGLAAIVRRSGGAASDGGS